VLGFASRQLAEEARARSAELDREGRSTSTPPHWPTAATTAGSSSCNRCGWHPSEQPPARRPAVSWGCCCSTRCCWPPSALSPERRGAGLSALGLNQWFLRQVDETLEPGRAALFVVVRRGARELHLLAVQAQHQARSRLSRQRAPHLLVGDFDRQPGVAPAEPESQAGHAPRQGRRELGDLTGRGGTRRTPRQRRTRRSPARRRAARWPCSRAGRGGPPGPPRAGGRGRAPGAPPRRTERAWLPADSEESRTVRGS
jgi:hypothetical protein